VFEDQNAPIPTSSRLVDTDADLRELCRTWRRRPALGIDTEFVRTRTFYPKLGLVQVSDGETNALVDPVKLEDLEPLAEIFRAEEIIKVFHSCGEDLEVLYHHFGAVPRPLFDNQLAAAFTGLGHSLGYHRLVIDLFDVDLPKGETRSNWLRRPLTEAQQRYAALDGAYLLPTYDILKPRLAARGRESWLTEEMEQLSNPARFLPDPETVYQSFVSHALNRRELAGLQAVAAWREREARRRDLPRNFVLHKRAMLNLIAAWPRNERALGKVPGLRPEDIRRDSREILALLREVDQLPSEKMPERLSRPLDLSPYSQQVEGLRSAVAAWAEELGLPVELIANRKTLERLARRILLGKDPVLGQDFTGWRRRLLEDVLSEVNLGEKPRRASR
jgi:ribonuclease D